jgi:hypothetical protein
MRSFVVQKVEVIVLFLNIFLPTYLKQNTRVPSLATVHPLTVHN